MSKKALLAIVLLTLTAMLPLFASYPAMAYHEFTVTFNPSADRLAAASAANPINVTMVYTLQYIEAFEFVDFLRVNIPSQYTMNVTATPKVWLYDASTGTWSDRTAFWVISKIPVDPGAAATHYIFQTVTSAAAPNEAGDKMRLSFYVVKPVVEGSYDFEVRSEDTKGDRWPETGYIKATHSVDNSPPSIISALPVNGTKHKTNLDVSVEASADTSVVFFGIAEENATLNVGYPETTVPGSKYYYKLTYNSTTKRFEGEISAANIDSLTMADGYEDYYALRFYASDGTYDASDPTASNWATRYHNNTFDNVAHGIDWKVIDSTDIELSPSMVFKQDKFKITWDWMTAGHPSGYNGADPFFQYFRIIVQGPYPTNALYINTTTINKYYYITVPDIGTYNVSIWYADGLTMWKRGNEYPDLNVIDPTFTFDVTNFIMLQLNGKDTIPGVTANWLYIPQGTSVNATATTFGLTLKSDMGTTLILTRNLPNGTAAILLSEVSMAYVKALTPTKLVWNYIIPENYNLYVGHYDVKAKWYENISKPASLIADSTGKYAVHTNILGDVMLGDTTYYYGETATFRTKLTDFYMVPLKDVKIAIKVMGPSSPELVPYAWLLGYTGPDGRVPQFLSTMPAPYYWPFSHTVSLFGIEIPHDWPEGGYQYLVNLTYTDVIRESPLLEYEVEEKRTGNFEIIAFRSATALDDISASLADVEANILSAVADLGDTLTSAMDDLSANLLSAMDDLSATLISAMADLSSTLSSAMADLSSTLSSAMADLSSTLTSAMADLSATLSSTLDAAVAEMQNDIAVASNTMLAAIDTAEDNIVSAVGSARSAITSAISASESSIRSAITSARTSIEGVIASAESSLATAISSAESTIGSAVDSAKADVLSAVSSAQSSITSAVNAAKNDISSAVSSAQSSITSAVNSAKDEVKQVISLTETAIQSSVNSVGEAVTAARQDIKSAVTSAESSIKSEVSNAQSAIITTVDSAKNAVNSAVDNVRTAVSNAESSIKARIDSTSEDLATTIKDSSADLSGYMLVISVLLVITLILAAIAVARLWRG